MPKVQISQNVRFSKFSKKIQKFHGKFWPKFENFEIVANGPFFGPKISVSVHYFISSPTLVRFSTKNSKKCQDHRFGTGNSGREMDKNSFGQNSTVKSDSSSKFSSQKTGAKFLEFSKNSVVFSKFSLTFSKSSYFNISLIFSLYRVFQIFLLKTYFTDFQKPK